MVYVCKKGEEKKYYFTGDKHDVHMHINNERCKDTYHVRACTRPVVSCLYTYSVHYSRRVLCRVQLHSVKKALHSVKPLPSAALGKELSAYLFTAKASLPSAACRALGKGFPECHDGTRQRKAAVMARSQWRPLCRVPRVGTRQRNVFFIFYFKKCFAECLHLALGKTCFLFFWIFFAQSCR